MNRRSFISQTSAASLSFLGLQRYLSAAPSERVFHPYGKLQADPKGILDLPEHFTYHIISKSGERMDDGYRVPGKPDGMAAFPGKNCRIILVRNHELHCDKTKHSPFKNAKSPDATLKQAAYDFGSNKNTPPHIGGTTNIIYNPQTQKAEKQFLSLTGTDRNCAGGVMPWGSWITCEEPEDLTSQRGRLHGYCFEVKASDDGKLQKAIPLKGLGRFCHEAVALDPTTGILYLTEDVNNGLLYRYIPNTPRDFQNGKLQALAIKNTPQADTRNYPQTTNTLQQGATLEVEWIDLENTNAPDNDLRIRGHQAGAAIFARGEGIIYEKGIIYICCTDGGPLRQGQIFILTPSPTKDSPDTLELFLQPQASDLLTNGDNLCSAPWGDLIICEDLIAEHANKRPHIRGITPEGQIYTLARNAKDNSEFAGSCFSPDGQTLFVNMQGLGLTLAITPKTWKK